MEKMKDETTSLTIQIGKDLKESVGKILKDFDLDHTTLINHLYRQISHKKKIPFPMFHPNKATQNAIKEFETNSNVKKYKTVEELFNDIG